MIKLGKEILLGEIVKYTGEYTTVNCRVVLNGKNKGFFTSEGFIKIKQRSQYLIVG